MSSLKDKFDDYREEPQYVTWQQLLKRLNAEMPVRKKRRYLLWLIPVFFISTTTALWMLSDGPAKPSAAKKENKVEHSSAAPVANNNTSVNTHPDALPVNGKKENATANTTNYNTPQNFAPVPNPVNPSVISGPAPVVPKTPDPVIEPPVKYRTVVNQISFKPLEIKNQDLVFDKPDFIIQEKVDSFSDPNLKPAVKVGRDFVLEIYYAPGVSNVFLKDPISNFIGSKTAANNKANRKSINKMGFSYTTGFGLKMDINKDFRIKTGYYFTQVSQTMYYNAEPAKCNCGQSSPWWQVDVNVNLINAGDSISKGNSNSFTNKYSLREIPVIFEYSKPTLKYRNLSYTLNFGMSYMYMSGINVRIPDADNVGLISIFYKTSDPAIFPSYKDAFNLIMGGGLIYKAQRNVEYMLAPQLKFAVTSLSKNDRFFREYPYQMQLAFGVGKRF